MSHVSICSRQFSYSGAGRRRATGPVQHRRGKTLATPPHLAARPRHPRGVPLAVAVPFSLQRATQLRVAGPRTTEGNRLFDAENLHADRLREKREITRGRRDVGACDVNFVCEVFPYFTIRSYWLWSCGIRCRLVWDLCRILTSSITGIG